MPKTAKIILIEPWRDADGKVQDAGRRLTLDSETAENLILAGLARKA